MSPAETRQRLSDMLLEQGLVTEAQLKECLDVQRTTGRNLNQVLVERGYLAEEELVVLLSEQLGIPYIRVANYTIPKEVLSQVPEVFARQYLMLPISITGNTLTLAMVNPLNVMAFDEVRMLTGYEIETVIAIESELIAAIESQYAAEPQT